MPLKRFFIKLITISIAAVMLLTLITSTAFADNDLSLDEHSLAGSDNEIIPVKNPAKSITLIPKISKKYLTIGQSFQLKYKLSPSGSDDIITFKSANEAVAVVSDDGIVTGINTGRTKISITTSKGVTKTINITIGKKYTSSFFSPDKVKSIDLFNTTAMLRVGKTHLIEYSLNPLGAIDSLTYKSANANIAKVSAKGIVTGVAAGNTIITLTSSNGCQTKFYVTVYDGLYKGIDVSKWQGKINWSKVSSTDVDFVMIRSSFGNSDVDSFLSANVAGCEKYGIPYGFYHYIYAKTTAEAKKEARFFIKTINYYNPEYPIVLDIENELYDSMTKEKVTNIITAFMDEIEKAGYYATIYSYANFLTSKTNMNIISKYNIWIASWGDESKLSRFFDHPYGMWQYSATGRISGINGDVDLDYAYKDFAEIIRKNKLNNLK